MPTYQYACTECGHDFEAVQSFSDASLTECPRCQGRLRKVFGAVGIVFKGSGFYRTDSRDKKPAAESGSDAKPAEKKTDAKPDKPGSGKDSGSAATPTPSTSGGSPKSGTSSTAGSAA